MNNTQTILKLPKDNVTYSELDFGRDYMVQFKADEPVFQIRIIQDHENTIKVRKFKPDQYKRWIDEIKQKTDQILMVLDLLPDKNADGE